MKLRLILPLILCLLLSGCVRKLDASDSLNDIPEASLGPIIETTVDTSPHPDNPWEINTNKNTVVPVSIEELKRLNNVSSLIKRYKTLSISDTLYHIKISSNEKGLIYQYIKYYEYETSGKAFGIEYDIYNGQQYYKEDTDQFQYIFLDKSQLDTIADSVGNLYNQHIVSTKLFDYTLDKNNDYHFYGNDAEHPERYIEYVTDSKYILKAIYYLSIQDNKWTYDTVYFEISNDDVSPWFSSYATSEVELRVHSADGTQTIPFIYNFKPIFITDEDVNIYIDEACTELFKSEDAYIQGDLDLWVK